MSTSRLTGVNRGQQARLLKPWLHALKQEMKRDPKELAYKRAQRGVSCYVINDRVVEWAHKLMEAGWATGEMQKKRWPCGPVQAYLLGQLKRGKSRIKYRSI